MTKTTSSTTPGATIKLNVDMALLLAYLHREKAPLEVLDSTANIFKAYNAALEESSRTDNQVVERLRTKIEALAEKKSLLHMPMVDLDPASLEYGEVSGLRLALEIIKAEITADTKSKAKGEGLA